MNYVRILSTNYVRILSTRVVERPLVEASAEGRRPRSRPYARRHARADEARHPADQPTQDLPPADAAAVTRILGAGDGLCSGGGGDVCLGGGVGGSPYEEGG